MPTRSSETLGEAYAQKRFLSKTMWEPTKALLCALRTRPSFQSATSIIMDRRTQWSLESLAEAGHGGPTCTWRLSLNSDTVDARRGMSFGARTTLRSHVRNRPVASVENLVP